MVDRVGQQFGNYRLVRLLGKGAFAEVYLGEHIHLGTQAAIKVLTADLIGNEIEQFRNEARLIAHLVHDHIVPVLDFDIENSIPFLVMSYAPNGSLRNRHPKGTQVPLATVVSYIKQITPALQYAHFRKHIHRDVKPENILLKSNDKIWLSDFGIAAIAHNTSSLNTQGYAGTAIYSAPEQIQGKPRLASDQYSLGIMVYEWLAGTPPFTGNILSVIHHHIDTPPPSLRARVPSISPEIEQVVLRVLAKEPEQRFPSISAFGKELEQAYLAAHRPISMPVTWVLPSAKPDAQPATSPLAVGTVLHSYRGYGRDISAIAWLSSGPHAASSDINGTIQIWDIANGKCVRTYSGHSQEVLSMTWSPDGQFIASGGNDQTVQVWDVRTGDCHLTYRGHDQAVEMVAWSPDGKRIVSGNKRGFIQIWDVATGQLGHYKGIGIGSIFINALAWSPNGRWIASSNGSSLDESVVEVWDATTGNLFSRYSVDTEDKGKRGARRLSSPALSIAWSPDSTRIVSGSYNKDSTIHVWDVTTGEGRRITTHSDNFKRYSGDDFLSALAWSPDGKLIASSLYKPYEPVVDVWDAETGKTVFEYRGHSQIALTIAWSPDGSSICSSSWDKTIVEAWQVATKRRIATHQDHADEVDLITWSPNGKQIASIDLKGNCHIWDTTTGKKLYALPEKVPHMRGNATLEWSPNGNYIAVASDKHTGGMIYIWDSITEKNVAIDSYSSVGYSVKYILWSPHSTHIAFVGNMAQWKVQFYDVGKGEKIREYRSEDMLRVPESWSPNGQWLSSSDKSGTICIWDFSTEKEICKYQGHSEAVDKIVWSPNGTLIASTSDRYIQVWDPATGRHHILCQGAFRVGCVDLMWSDDSTRIIGIDYTGDVYIWDSDTGKQLTSYTPRGAGGKDIWSPDSKYVALTDTYAGWKTQVLDVVTGNHVADYGSFSRPAWSRDSSCIAFVPTVITVQVWRTPRS